MSICTVNRRRSSTVVTFTDGRQFVYRGDRCYVNRGPSEPWQVLPVSAAEFEDLITLWTVPVSAVAAYKLPVVQ